MPMRVIAKKALREFWEAYPDAEQPLKAWYNEVSNAVWNNPADIKNHYRNASFIANNRVVFYIKGNDYRLIVHVRYDKNAVYVRFIGTHQEYDKVDAANI